MLYRKLCDSYDFDQVLTTAAKISADKEAERDLKAKSVKKSSMCTLPPIRKRFTLMNDLTQKKIQRRIFGILTMRMHDFELCCQAQMRPASWICQIAYPAATFVVHRLA